MRKAKVAVIGGLAVIAAGSAVAEQLYPVSLDPGGIALHEAFDKPNALPGALSCGTELTGIRHRQAALVSE